jgi:glucosamine-6-phosphate deaminase
MKAAGEYSYEKMKVHIHPDIKTMGRKAAEQVAEILKNAVKKRGEASAIFASANSQLDFLARLRETEGIPWNRITVFHMDEYLGMAASHPASFRRFLRRELVSFVNPKEFEGIIAESADIGAEMERYTKLLEQFKPDLCVLGIGENGHLAFNDPPADFTTKKTIHLVDLDEKCRNQQVGEGHYASLKDVPTKAVSLTIPALLRPTYVIGVVPEARKAEPVKNALEGPVTPACPASILRKNSNVSLYLDQEAASLLE